MNVLQKTGRKQEALPFRVNERNGDVTSIDNCERLIAAVGQKRLDGSKLYWGI
jgi:hypothetical protein